MAQRRNFFGDVPFPTPASPMTPKGGSQVMYGDPSVEPMVESKETFRRRNTPITGYPEPQPTSFEQILALLGGGTS